MPPATRNLTILLTDIKGFTDKTSQQTRSQTLEMLERHRAVVLPVLEGRGGKLIKTIGDAFLMSFDSPTDAVLAGVAVQDALRAHNEGRADDERLDIRIAINCGEVTLADNDVFGEPVNITARIESVAEAGEVFFTEAVYLAMNKAEVPSSEVGLLQLKGIPEKIRVYKVKRETPLGANAAPPRGGPGLREPAAKASFANPAPPAVPAPVHAAASMKRRLGALCLDLLLCLAVAECLPEGDYGDRHDEVEVSDVTLEEGRLKVKGGGVDLDVGLDGKVHKLKTPPTPSRPYRGRSPWDQFKFPLLWIVYSGLCLKRWGTTLGGKWCRLTVVRVDGLPLDKSDRWTRAGVSVISAMTCGLGYAWALWDKEGRGWHDHAAGTKVVALLPLEKA